MFSRFLRWSLKEKVLNDGSSQPSHKAQRQALSAALSRNKSTPAENVGDLGQEVESLLKGMCGIDLPKRPPSELCGNCQKNSIIGPKAPKKQKVTFPHCENLST